MYFNLIQECQRVCTGCIRPLSVSLSWIRPVTFLCPLLSEIYTDKRLSSVYSTVLLY